MTFLPRLSNHSKKSLTMLKSNLCWNTIASFWARNWQRIEYFFRIHPRSKIRSLSDCTQAMILLPRASILLNKSLTRLKSDLCWNNIARFWARNLTTYSVPFFVYHLGQQLFSSHTVLGQWHSSLDSRIIQKIPWLGWNANYVETL